MKLHLGCGKRYLKGYKHIDYSSYEHIDWNSPIYPLPFIENNSIDEIYSSHALEYFDFIQVREVLIEWRRCLKKGGKLRLSVPDFDKLIKVYNLENNEIDSIVGPLFGRWNIDEKNFIYHRTVFNKPKLEKLIIESGFDKIDYWDPLTYFGDTQDSFDDYSKAFYPHMDFLKGFPISINLLAEKHN